AGLADGTAGSLDEVIALAAAYAANPSARGPMPTRTPPARPASAAEPPPAEAKPSRYAEGDPVTIIADNVVGTITSTDCYEVMVEGEDVPRRCLGDELEPVEVAAAPAAQSRTPLPRSFAAAVAHASGLSAGASDAAARLQAAAMLGLAAAVLAATGKKDADSALGVLDARFAAAAQVPELRRQLAAKSAQAEAEAKTAADHAAAKERSALLEQAIALGTAPALVYETTAGAAGEKVLAETAWAKGQTNAQLAAFVETSKGLGGFALAAGEKRPDVSEDGAISAPHLASLTADERAYCAQTGRDPALFARTKSTLFGAKSAGKEA
ncbi:MAG: hypothetical protein ABI193_15240, partial [Minicystis sp.]